MSLKKLFSFNLMKKFNWSESHGEREFNGKSFSTLKWRLLKMKNDKNNFFHKRESFKENLFNDSTRIY